MQSDLTPFSTSISSPSQGGWNYAVTDGAAQRFTPYTDHLGSIVAITDESGAILTHNGEEVRMDFDPWGRERDHSDWSYVNSSHYVDSTLPSWLWRGYIGHVRDTPMGPIGSSVVEQSRDHGKMLPEFGLINMCRSRDFWRDHGDTIENVYDIDVTRGRCYDPVVGRMLSPDNYVQDPNNGQNYNRYAYVLNNPLKYTDPSGEVISPIYDLDGNFLGTDNEGIQGEALFMDENDFTQNMDHDEAVKLDLGFESLLSGLAEMAADIHYSNLSSRPDWDGMVTIQEGIDWAKSHPGALENPTPDSMLYINTGEMDFGFTSAQQFASEKIVTPINLLSEGNLHAFVENERLRNTVYALGCVNMVLTNRANREVSIVNDYHQARNRATDYDWNSGGTSLRSALIRLERTRAWVNDSHGFRVVYYGTGTLFR